MTAFAVLFGFGVALAAIGATTAEAQTSASIGGMVTDDRGTVEGVSVDLFAADVEGNRTEWLGSTVTGVEGPGTFRFAVEPGCYAVTAIAPQGRTFIAGSRWSTTGVCVRQNESRLDIGAALLPADSGTVSGTVILDGVGPFDDIKVDLFTAQANGGRGEWLRSTTTGSREGAGIYRFDGLLGCYVLTYVIESDQFQFTESGAKWLNRNICLEAGQLLEGVDASLIATEQPTQQRLTAQVLGDGIPVSDITVDLFADDGTGGRGRFISSMATDGAGTVTFPADPGCYVATFVASEETIWQRNGSTWLNVGVCLDDQPVADLGPVILVGSSEQSNTLDVAVTKHGEIVGGVVVDIFAADASGNRGEFIASGRTVPGRRTTLDLAIGDGCRIITMVAPGADVFAETGTRWLNLPFCTSPEQDVYSFDAMLAARPTACASGSEFERVFRDDFDGDALSADDWATYNSSGNAGFGLRRPSAVTVEGGALVITAEMEQGLLVHGGIAHRFDQKYGKYRFRVRTDNDSSQATSGAVLTWPESGVHPRDGENMMYETLVRTPERNPFYSFIHKPFGSVADREFFVHNADASQFQVMTMEWTPGRIIITREGPGGSQVSETHVITETEADLIPDNPHRLTIQLDAWKHSMDGTVRMEVDWVEVHKYCG